MTVTNIGQVNGAGSSRPRTYLLLVPMSRMSGNLLLLPQYASVGLYLDTQALSLLPVFCYAHNTVQVTTVTNSIEGQVEIYRAVRV